MEQKYLEEQGSDLLLFWFLLFNGLPHHFINIICHQHQPEFSVTTFCLSFRSVIPAERIYYRRIFHTDTNCSLAVNNHIPIKIIPFIAKLLADHRNNSQLRKPFILKSHSLTLHMTIWSLYIKTILAHYWFNALGQAILLLASF